MPKRKHSNTDALRDEFSEKLSSAIKGLRKKSVAEKLGISRQMLRLYLKKKATPGGEVIKKACDEWKLSLSIKGFQFTAGAFGGTTFRKRRPRSKQPELFDLLDKLEKNQLEAEIVGRDGNSYLLRLRIRLAA